MTVEAMVLRYLQENFLFSDDGKLGNDDSLMETGVLDSTGVLELIAFLEGTFEIVVEDEEMLPENLDSIARIGEYVRRKTAGAGAPTEV